MSDFNFYLNRVGVRGPKGEQGEQGFSPIITVATDTLSEYILQIQTQNNTFLTANLREHKDDLGGTYIRYNRETGVMYAGEADTATTQNLGEVRFATATELERNDGSTVVTPADVNTMINAKGYDAAIEAVDDKADANADNIATNTNNISTLQGQMAGVLGNYVTTNTTQTITGNKTFTGTTTTGYLQFNNGLYAKRGSQYYQVLAIDGMGLSSDPYYIHIGGQYGLLLDSNRPTIETKRDGNVYTNIDSGNISGYLPAVGNGTITFTQGGVTKGTITTNQSGNATIDFDAGGGSAYTAGNGIDITNDEISIDTNVVALKSDIPDVSNMVTTDTLQTITGTKQFNLLGCKINSNYNITTDVNNFPRPVITPRPNNELAFGNLYLDMRLFSKGDIYVDRYDNTTGDYVQTENIDAYNIGSHALTSSNISTNAYIQALEARIAALEANINGGNA